MLKDDCLDFVIGYAAKDIAKLLDDPSNEEARWQLAEYARKNVGRLGGLCRDADFKDEFLTFFGPFKYDFISRFLMILFRDGIQGNREAVDTTRKIYRIVARDEYNWIKRQKSLQIHDVMLFVGFPETEEDDDNMDFMHRIVCLAQVLGIPLEFEIGWQLFYSAQLKGLKAGMIPLKNMYQNYLDQRKKYRDLFRTAYSDFDDELCKIMFQVGSWQLWFYDGLERGANMEEFANVLREDGEDPIRSATAYLKICGYEPTKDLVSAIASQVDYIRMFTAKNLSNRMFSLQCLNLFGGALDESALDEEKLSAQTINELAQIGLLEKLKEENSELKNKLTNEKGKNRAFHEELNRLRKREEEHDLYASKMKKRVDLRDQELDALRRALLRNDEPGLNRSEDDMIALLSSKNACLIGGHPNWVNKIRVLLPNWKYFEAGELRSRDSSSIVGMDCAYIFTGHLDHTTYYKVIQIVRSADVPIGYIDSVNIRKSLEQFCAVFDNSD